MRVILLPGLDGTGLLFKPLLDELPNDIVTEVISYPVNENLDYMALEKLIRSQLPKDEGFILVAESFSGVLAYNIAKNKPHNLKSIIFVASFLKPPIRYLKLFNWLPLSLIFKLPIPDFFLRYYMFGKNISSSIINLFKESIYMVTGNVLSYRFREVSNLRVDVDRLNVPCIYIHAEDDNLVPIVNLDIFREVIPDLKVVYMRGPHFILQSNPTECAVVIIDEYRFIAQN